mmetsp:Transcript_41069/g.81029  ORF Transcript_41069/g.81029 Transcript_41069/m.81029 type:complete len:413 (+) Transcript_41069:354-1592(+)
MQGPGGTDREWQCGRGSCMSGGLSDCLSRSFSLKRRTYRHTSKLSSVCTPAGGLFFLIPPSSSFAPRKFFSFPDSFALRLLSEKEKYGQIQELSLTHESVHPSSLSFSLFNCVPSRFSKFCDTSLPPSFAFPCPSCFGFSMGLCVYLNMDTERKTPTFRLSRYSQNVSDRVLQEFLIFEPLPRETSKPSIYLASGSCFVFFAPSSRCFPPLFSFFCLLICPFKSSQPTLLSRLSSLPFIPLFHFLFFILRYNWRWSKIGVRSHAYNTIQAMQASAHASQNTIESKQRKKSRLLLNSQPPPLQDAAQTCIHSFPHKSTHVCFRRESVKKRNKRMRSDQQGHSLNAASKVCLSMKAVAPKHSTASSATWSFFTTTMEIQESTPRFESRPSCWGAQDDGGNVAWQFVYFICGGST